MQHNSLHWLIYDKTQQFPLMAQVKQPLDHDFLAFLVTDRGMQFFLILQLMGLLVEFQLYALQGHLFP